MTKIQFDKQLNKLTREVVRVVGEECQRLLKSGAVDLEAYQNDFMLPKIILSVALKNAAYHFTPLSPEWQKEMKNLMHF